MKTIYKGQDDLWWNVDVSGADGRKYLPTDLAVFDVRIFTTDLGKALEYGASDCGEGLLRVPAEDLARLGDGPLRMKFLLGVSDSAWRDGKFDSTAVRNTGYFLKTPTEAKK